MASKSSEAGARPRWSHWALALFLLAVVGLLGVLGARTLVRTFGSLDKEVAAAIVTATLAALAAIGTAFVSRWFDRRRTSEQVEREARTPVYEAFVSGLLGVMGVTKPPAEREGLDEAAAVKVLGAFTEKLVIWGSDDVIRAWGKWRYTAIAAGSSGSQAQGVQNLVELENLLLALRNDLGLRNKNLKRGDLLRLWINDLPADWPSPGADSLRID